MHNRTIIIDIEKNITSISHPYYPPSTAIEFEGDTIIYHAILFSTVLPARGTCLAQFLTNYFKIKFLRI